MEVDATSESSGQASFWDAVKLGATVGLVPGAILGIAYMSIPSVATRAELLGTAALFVLFSSLFGVIIGGCIYNSPDRFTKPKSHSGEGYHS